MNYFEAVALLNRLKDGQDVGFAEISNALCLTGDREFPSDVRSEILGESIPRETEDSWENRSLEVVERYSRRHQEKAGRQSSAESAGAHE